MTIHPLNPVRSERGIALIVVLLLLGVMAALTTGLTLSGSTEVSMASNEMYYAGARAAAEAGMNRAVRPDPQRYRHDLMTTRHGPRDRQRPVRPHRRSIRIASSSR